MKVKVFIKKLLKSIVPLIIRSLYNQPKGGLASPMASGFDFVSSIVHFKTNSTLVLQDPLCMIVSL